MERRARRKLRIKEQKKRNQSGKKKKGREKYDRNRGMHQ